MLNFDPIDLEDYAPFQCFTLKQVYEIAYFRVAASFYNCNYRTPDEEFINVRKVEEMVRLDYYDQKCIWTTIRGYAADGSLPTFTLDGNDIVPVNMIFWRGKEGLVSLSTGEIPTRGTVFVRSEHALEVLEAFDKYDEYFTLGGEESSADSDDKSDDRPSHYQEQRAKLPPGRRRSFDVEIFLREFIRILIRDRPDLGKYGMKKEIRAKVTSAYESIFGKDKLPSDDTIERYLIKIVGDSADQSGRLIPHKPG